MNESLTQAGIPQVQEILNWRVPAIFREPMGTRMSGNHIILEGRGIVRNINIYPDGQLVSDSRYIKIGDVHVSGTFCIDNGDLYFDRYSIVIWPNRYFRLWIENNEGILRVTEERRGLSVVTRAPSAAELDLYEGSRTLLGEPDESLKFLLI